MFTKTLWLSIASVLTEIVSERTGIEKTSDICGGTTKYTFYIAKQCNENKKTVKNRCYCGPE